MVEINRQNYHNVVNYLKQNWNNIAGDDGLSMAELQAASQQFASMGNSEADKAAFSLLTQQHNFDGLNAIRPFDSGLNASQEDLEMFEKNIHVNNFAMNGIPVIGGVIRAWGRGIAAMNNNSSDSQKELNRIFEDASHEDRSTTNKNGWFQDAAHLSPDADTLRNRALLQESVTRLGYDYSVLDPYGKNYNQDEQSTTRYGNKYSDANYNTALAKTNDQMTRDNNFGSQPVAFQSHPADEATQADINAEPTYGSPTPTPVINSASPSPSATILGRVSQDNSTQPPTTVVQGEVYPGGQVTGGPVDSRSVKKQPPVHYPAEAQIPPPSFTYRRTPTLQANGFDGAMRVGNGPDIATKEDWSNSELYGAVQSPGLNGSLVSRENDFVFSYNADDGLSRVLWAQNDGGNAIYKTFNADGSLASPEVRGDLATVLGHMGPEALAVFQSQLPSTPPVAGQPGQVLPSPTSPSTIVPPPSSTVTGRPGGMANPPNVTINGIQQQIQVGRDNLQVQTNSLQ
ncbi:MAG: hypothetical protein SFZ03_10580 [Candidatus Melainabacteria bacterium]|nr:hypothetical protein [Candidatus Melainabacteria bacterium]